MTASNGQQQSEILDRLPPSDIAAEKAVIGALLVMGDADGKIREIVQPNDFYTAALRSIARELWRLAERPDWSDRAIADHVGVSDKTVAAVRQEIEQDQLRISAVEEKPRVGRDGRKRKAKPKRKPEPEQLLPEGHFVLPMQDGGVAEVYSGDINKLLPTFNGSGLTAAEQAGVKTKTAPARNGQAIGDFSRVIEFLDKATRAADDANRTAPGGRFHGAFLAGVERCHIALKEWRRVAR